MTATRTDLDTLVIDVAATPIGHALCPACGVFMREIRTEPHGTIGIWPLCAICSANHRHAGVES